MIPPAPPTASAHSIAWCVPAGCARSASAISPATNCRPSSLALQSRLGLTPFRALQNNYNLAIREFDAPLRELCTAAGVTVITYSPLGAGFLTGKHRGGVEPGSRFDIVPAHQNVYFNPVAERRLTKLAEVSAHSHRLPNGRTSRWRGPCTDPASAPFSLAAASPPTSTRRLPRSSSTTPRYLPNWNPSDRFSSP